MAKTSNVPDKGIPHNSRDKVLPATEAFRHLPHYSESIVPKIKTGVYSMESLLPPRDTKKPRDKK
jgi:hypothetical protein